MSNESRFLMIGIHVGMSLLGALVILPMNPANPLAWTAIAFNTLVALYHLHWVRR